MTELLEAVRRARSGQVSSVSVVDHISKELHEHLKD